MTYNQLKYFNTVCKYNNISKAAEKLFISPPSVSLAIKELEEELGTQLFLRSNNKLFMTESGKMLWEMSEEVLNEMEMITDIITRKNQEKEQPEPASFPGVEAEEGRTGHVQHRSAEAGHCKRGGADASGG